MKASALVMSGAVIASACNFLAQMVFAKRLPTEDYGILIASLSMAQFLGPLAAFGFGLSVVQMYAKGNNASYSLLNKTVKITIISSLFSIFVFILWSIISFNEDKLLVSWLIGSAVLSFVAVQIGEASSQLSKDVKMLSLWQIAKHLILLIAAIYLVLQNGTILEISVIVFILNIILFFTVIRSIYNIFKSLKYSKVMIKGYETYTHALKISLPYMLSAMVYMVFFQSDMIVVALYMEPQYSAYYGLSITFVSAVYLFPRVVFKKVLLVGIYNKFHSVKDYSKVFAVSYLPLIFIFGIIVAAAFYIVIGVVVSLLFGDKYEPALQIMKLLSFCIPFRFVSIASSTVVADASLVSKRLIGESVIAVINVLGAIALVPTLGLVGAAYTTILVEIMLSCYYVMFLLRFARL